MWLIEKMVRKGEILSILRIFLREMRFWKTISILLMFLMKTKELLDQKGEKASEAKHPKVIRYC